MTSPRCIDCGQPLTKGLTDHAYRYDRGAPIQLRAITKWSCACGYWDVEIPRMGPLHEAIAAALRVLRVKRTALVLFFKEGARGVEDGEWGMVVPRVGEDGSSPLDDGDPTPQVETPREVAANPTEVEHHADLVVANGETIKNRYGAIGKAVSLPDGCYALTRIGAADALVHVSSLKHDHPYEGLIICRDHLRSVFDEDLLPAVLTVLPVEVVAFWRHRCLMCGVDAVPGRLCENAGCRRPLHPQWPAVYCKNACALEDA